MAGSCEYGWLNAQRADGRCARDTMMMMMMSEKFQGKLYFSGHAQVVQNSG